MPGMNQNPLRDDAPPARRLGEKIKSARLALIDGRGLNQRQFAHLLGVGQGTVSKWENGALVPSSTDLAAILRQCDSLDPVECLRLLNEHRDLKRKEGEAA